MSNVTVPAAAEGMPAAAIGSNPADDVNRAKAVVLTVWLALQSPDILTGCDGDIGAIGDTLYEAYLKLRNAEKNLGVHS